MPGLCQEHQSSALLGIFHKINFVMSVRPSVRMEQLGFHWADFREILYLSFFFVPKIYREYSSFITM